MPVWASQASIPAGMTAQYYTFELIISYKQHVGSKAAAGIDKRRGLESGRSDPAEYKEGYSRLTVAMGFPKHSYRTWLRSGEYAFLTSHAHQEPGRRVQNAFPAKGDQFRCAGAQQ